MYFGTALFVLSISALPASSAGGLSVVDVSNCSVVVAGGSLAAFAAAIASASEGVSTCLIEPTDWVGGQATSSGVPAIDFAWHVVVDNATGFVDNVAAAAHDPANMSPNFWAALSSLSTQGRCWVSTKCFPPQELLQNALWPMQQNVSKYLQVFLSTVVKEVVLADNATIASIVAIQRSPQPGLACNGYDLRLSQDLADWYDPSPSQRWQKSVLQLSSGDSARPALFVDATEWGEVLALSGAPYLQGIDEEFDGDVRGGWTAIGNDTCGQSITVDFVELLHANETSEPPNPYDVPHPEFYGWFGFNWTMIWKYRRLLSTQNDPSPGDLTVQNWNAGNDYVYQYLFLSKDETRQSASNGSWSGGVDLSTLDAAERAAFGWHYWFKNHSDAAYRGRVTIDGAALGTCHGLAKMPYMRDTRRSIGLDDFVMTIDDVTGVAEDIVGEIYYDRVALGSYDVDIHSLHNCSYPAYMAQRYDVLPYFIPFRAMTNVRFGNLLVAGKTMAQTFLTNSATRLHPVEWNAGTAAGAAAAYMAQNSVATTSEALANHLEAIQKTCRRHTPASWTIQGKLYPPF